MHNHKKSDLLKASDSIITGITGITGSMASSSYSSDFGSSYGSGSSGEYNACFVNALVGALTLRDRSVDPNSVDDLLRNLRTRNGEYMSPLDESSESASASVPALHSKLKEFLLKHRVGITLFVDGKKYLVFKNKTNGTDVVELNLVNHTHWEVLVDLSAYTRSKAMAREEAMNRAAAQAYHNLINGVS